MKIRRIITTVLPLMLLITMAHAQQGRPRAEERRENIESMKIAYITKELDLSPEEAKRFWPVYNSYSDELRKIRESRRARMKDARGEFDNMADRDIEKLIDSEMTSRQQELDIQKQYHAKFKEVLPVRKVAMLYRAEDGFKKELLEKIKERRQGGGPGRQ